MLQLFSLTGYARIFEAPERHSGYFTGGVRRQRFSALYGPSDERSLGSIPWVRLMPMAISWIVRKIAPSHASWASRNRASAAHDHVSQSEFGTVWRHFITQDNNHADIIL